MVSNDFNDRQIWFYLLVKHKVLQVPQELVVHDFPLEFWYLCADMLVIMTQLRDLNLLLRYWKAYEKPPVANNADFTSKNFAFIVNLRSWERSFLGLTFAAKPKATELAGSGFPFFNGGRAKVAVWVNAIKRRKGPRKIEDWRVFLDLEFSVTYVEMSKLKF